MVEKKNAVVFLMILSLGAGLVDAKNPDDVNADDIFTELVSNTYTCFYPFPCEAVFEMVNPFNDHKLKLKNLFFSFDRADILSNFEVRVQKDGDILWRLIQSSDKLDVGESCLIRIRGWKPLSIGGNDVDWFPGITLLKSKIPGLSENKILKQSKWADWNDSVGFWVDDFDDELGLSDKNNILISGGRITSNTSWYLNSSIIDGLGDIGLSSAPTVYQKDSVWHLIAGQSLGVFYGFQWNGTSWVSNSSIVSGLEGLGYATKPTVYQKDSVWHLISGQMLGVFYGFQWNGTGWVSNSSIVSGLGDVGDFSAPTVYQKDSVWHLISGEYGGIGEAFNGFQWNGTSWVSNSSIGLLESQYDYTTPTVYQRDSTWYLISGESGSSEDFFGLQWNGTGWVSDSLIKLGLTSVGSHTTPNVYEKNNTWHLITGKDDGKFVGYQWVVSNISNLTSTIITPTYLGIWNQFCANINYSSGTNVTFQILNTSNNVSISGYNNITLGPGGDCFSVSELSTDYNTIRLFLNGSTTNTSNTFELFGWNITWNTSVHITKNHTIPLTPDFAPTNTTFHINATSTNTTTYCNLTLCCEANSSCVIDNVNMTQHGDFWNTTRIIDKDGKWNWSVTCGDNYGQTHTIYNNFSVYNDVPENLTSTITPTPAETSDNLTGTCTGDDQEGATLTYSYLWFNNSIATSLTSQIIGSGNTTVGDNWTLQCNASDGYNNTLLNSSVLTIGDSTPPTLTCWMGASSGYTDIAYKIYCNCSDAAGELMIGYPKVDFIDPNLDRKGNYSMTNETSPKYSKSYTFNIPGAYTDFNFYCSDGSGNMQSNTSNTYTFTSSTRPAEDGNGGGGGTTPSPPVVGNLTAIPPQIYEVFLLPFFDRWLYEVKFNREVSSCLIAPPFSCAVNGSSVHLLYEVNGSSEVMYVVGAELKVTDSYGEIAYVPVNLQVINLGGGFEVEPMDSVFANSTLFMLDSEGLIVGVRLWWIASILLYLIYMFFTVEPVRRATPSWME